MRERNVSRAQVKGSISKKSCPDMNCSPKKPHNQGVFAFKMGAKGAFGRGDPFFAFSCSSTIYGAGEKNPRFFDFFSYFFGHFENRSSRAPLGKSKFPLQTVCKGNFDFPKGVRELRFSK